MNILLWIVFGALTGWIAGLIMKSSYGVVWDIIIGISGAFIGSAILNFFGQQGLTGFNFYSLIVSVLGASILFFILKSLRN